MRKFSLFIALLAISLCNSLVFGEEGDNAKPAVEFVAPSNADPKSDTGADATFINPESAQSEEPKIKTNASNGGQDASQLNQTVIRSVKKKALREKTVKTEEQQDVEQATNTGFAPEGAAKPQEVGADQKPTEAAKLAPIDEKGANETVKGGFSSNSTQGALAYFKGKSLLETSFYQAVQRALDKNLTVKFSDKAYLKSEYPIVRAKAVFDPVFNLTINGSQTDTFERREFINRRRFIAGELQNEIVDAIFNTTEAREPDDPVEGFKRRGAFERAGQRARFRTETVSENFTQNLPWGSLFNLNFTQKHSKTIFQEFTREDSFTINDSEVQLDANGQVQPILGSDGINQRKRSVFFEQHGRIARDRTQKPWSTSLNVQLRVPIPYTKDWGPYGPTEVPIKFAEIAHERAYWDLQGAITDTLLNVNLNYWELVRAIRRVELTIKTRQGMEKVFQQTEELVKAGRATGYESTQLKLQVASIRRGEQGEWANYVSRSNSLKNLLDEEKDTVILPVAYGNMFSAVPPITPEEAIAIAMANNPRIQSAKMDVEFAEVNLKFANNQARPDLKLTTGMSWTQTSAVYGYSGLGPSLAALMRPDRRDGFAVLNYRVPWGNKPAEEKVDEAEERLKSAQKNLLLVANSTDRAVQDAVTALNSARERAALAEKNKETVDNLYKMALDLWEKGRLPPLAPDRSNPSFEIVNKNAEVLNAGFRLIDAQIDVLQQEARLMAAEGTIANRYAQDVEINVKRVEEPKKDAPKEPEKKEEKK